MLGKPLACFPSLSSVYSIDTVQAPFLMSLALKRSDAVQIRWSAKVCALCGFPMEKGKVSTSVLYFIYKRTERQNAMNEMFSDCETRQLACSLTLGCYNSGSIWRKVVIALVIAWLKVVIALVVALHKVVIALVITLCKVVIALAIALL